MSHIQLYVTLLQLAMYHDYEVSRILVLCIALAFSDTLLAFSEGCNPNFKGKDVKSINCGHI